MRLALPALALALGAGCAASSDWSPAAAERLKKEMEIVLAAIDLGNFDAMLSRMDKDVVVLDLSENNAPVRMQGIEEVRKSFAGFKKAVEEQGLRFKSVLLRNDAYATETFGFCVAEFDQAITVGGQEMGPFKYRGTLVARKVGDEWKWTHWHGSLRETLPAAPK
ncbi:MAG: nuclear transport factor 2 family protein [Planctomycetales bacterium]|nr:nuclear transport factor 2 family protein [Planctomycetales bacterium]